MDLFVMVGKHVFPSTHALMIEPFKTMWEDDTSPGNEECIRVFTYIELLCSPKKSNPFFGVPEDQRSVHVKKEVWGDNIPEFDVTQASLVVQGVKKYKELLEIASPSYAMFEAAKAAADKVTHFLRTFDPATRTMSGSLVIKPKDVLLALEEIPETLQSLAVARTKILQEISEEDSKTRNQRTPGLFEE